jgi:hypothetical protein
VKNIVDALCEGDAAPGFDVPEEAEEVQLANEILRHSDEAKSRLIQAGAPPEIMMHLQAIEDAADQLVILHTQATASPEEQVLAGDEAADFRERHAEGDPTAIAQGEQ